MKKYYFILTLIISLTLFSNEKLSTIEGHPYDGTTTIFQDTITFSGDVTNDFEESISQYNKIKIGKFDILRLIESNTDLVYLNNVKFSVLIDSQNRVYSYGINRVGNSTNKSNNRIFEGVYLYKPSTIKASSELSEGEITYTANNLGLLNGGKPWVEGVKGYGIGESIKITTPRANSEIHTLIISIGYVNSKNLSLYEKNSRPSKIKLKSSKFNDEISLIDSPNPQIFHLKEKVDELTLEIAEVFEGTLWDDTCINFIYVATGMEEYFDILD